MREQACKYGAKIETEFVTQARARRNDRPVHRDLGLGLRDGAHVLLATGVTNRRPPMDEELHDEALARGLVRYCPICDGYEVTDKKVGVIGSDSHGVAEALFLRSYHRRRDPDRARQGAAAEARGLSASSRMRGSTASTGRPRRWRSPRTASSSTPPRAITPSTASIRRSAPTPTPSSPRWPARSSSRRCIMVDSHMRTSVRASMPPATSSIGLDQISHAMGEGGVAATTIRNDLRESSGHCSYN